MRASTGCAVGSDGDRRIEVVTADGATLSERAATGVSGGATVAEMITRAGGVIWGGGALRKDRRGRCREKRQARTDRLRAGGGKVDKPLTATSGGDNLRRLQIVSPGEGCAK
jgi:hypothetical protein